MVEFDCYLGLGKERLYLENGVVKSVEEFKEFCRNWKDYILWVCVDIGKVRYYWSRGKGWVSWNRYSWK